jgi:hypothetical protein
MSITRREEGMSSVNIGQIITWYDGATKEFEGVIVSTKRRTIPGFNNQPTIIFTDMRCVDYAYLLDRILVKEIFAESQAADVTAAFIVDNYTTGFTRNNIQTGAAGLPQQVFDYVPVTDAITQLARSSGWGWYVDFNRDVHFFAIETHIAPVPILDLDNDTGTIVTIEGVESSIEQMRNRVFLKDFRILLSNPYTETFVGDGTARYFGLHMEPSVDLSDTVLKVNGGAQSLLYDFLDGQPGDGVTASGTAYWCQTNWGIRFPDGSTPAPGTRIDAIYSAYSPENLYEIDDIPSQQFMEMQLGELGVFEYLHNANDLRVDGYNPIEYQGRILLSLYSPIFTQIVFKTQVKGWQASHTLVVNSVINGFDNKTMYVTSISKKPLTPNAFGSGDTVTEYTISIQSKPDVYL